MKPIRKFYKSSTFIKIQTQLSNNLHFLHEILDSIGVLYNKQINNYTFFKLKKNRVFTIQKNRKQIRFYF